MAVAIPPYQRRWTRAEYERLVTLGLFDGQRIERLEGEIIEMGPMLGPHAVALGLMIDALTPWVGRGAILRPQMPLALGDDPTGRDSDPEPDIALVAGHWRDFAATHPTTALLIVEIADSSLAYDRTRKTRAYARARVADYWIVNLVDRQVEIYRRPEPEPGMDGAWRYGEQSIAGLGDRVSPLARPRAIIAVRDVLP